jgi:hypothetical protein
MTYDLAQQFDLERFKARCNYLIEKGAAVDLTERTFRSSSQNRYLHLLIGLVALEVGETVEYVKANYFKRLVNPSIFIVTKVDKLAGQVETLRSSADLTKEEMSLAIDRFKMWGRQQGWAMPDPGDTEMLRQLEIELSRQSRYV